MAAEDRIGERNKKAILKAATLLFSRKGLEGTRIAEIAQKAGLPKPNVYYYFRSKQAIYRAIVEQLIAGWDRTLQHIAPDRDPFEALEAYVRAKLKHARQNAAESRMFAHEILGGASFLTPKDREHMRAATAVRVAVIDGWIAQGKIKPIDPRHFFVILWASTQFYSDFTVLARDALMTPLLKDSDYEAAARTIIETVLGSLRPDPDDASAATGELPKPIVR
jgi:AcrR family transcriptional regulator